MVDGQRACPIKCAIGAAALLAATLAPLPAAGVQSSAVSTLAGAWGGGGRIYYTDGSSESISCTAYYTGSGGDLRMAIQCRSDSNPIHIRSRLRIDGSRASGEWEERTFNASGTASGSVAANSLSLDVSGGGFSGTMSVSFSSTSHSVTITASGIAMRRATMRFTRR